MNKKCTITENQKTAAKTVPLRTVFGLLLASLLFSACGTTTATIPRDEAEGKKAAERAAGTAAGADEKNSEEAGDGTETSVNLPSRRIGSRILVDENGYDCSDERTAYFQGEGLGERFYLVSAKDDTRVYEGILEREKGSVSENTVYKGTFSGWYEPGIYYLQTAVIGQSEPFEISDDFYEKRRDALLREWKKQAEESCKKEALSEEEQLGIAGGLFSLGIACEVFPDAAPSLKESFLSVLGSAQQKILSAGDPETKALYLSAVTEAALLYPEEGDFADTAQRLYQNLSTETEGSVPARLLAEASLYKLTQDRSYAALPEEYLAGCKEVTEASFPVIWTYLTTKGSVDTDLCADLMKILIRHCNAGAAALEGTEELFDAQLLSLADYILSSTEYSTVRRSYYHKLSLKGEFEQETMEPEALARLFLLLCF